jgi:conjugation system TraG family ATPase
MTTLENKFPLLAVEHGCIISKDADITVAFEVELPELYTVTGAEYEAIHSCWCKAIKVLPDYSVVHKQDWFIKERYKPELQKDDMSFLSRSFERHFNERPYLKHTCYLYLTKTTKERNRMQSNFSTLCRGHIIPKELDRETDQVLGSLRTVRAHHERQRACQAAPPLHRRDCGYGGKDGTY